MTEVVVLPAMPPAQEAGRPIEDADVVLDVRAHPDVLIPLHLGESGASKKGGGGRTIETPGAQGRDEFVGSVAVTLRQSGERGLLGVAPVVEDGSEQYEP